MLYISLLMGVLSLHAHRSFPGFHEGSSNSSAQVHEDMPAGHSDGDTCNADINCKCHLLTGKYSSNQCCCCGFGVRLPCRLMYVSSMGHRLMADGTSSADLKHILVRSPEAYAYIMKPGATSCPPPPVVPDVTYADSRAAVVRIMEHLPVAYPGCQARLGRASD